MSNEAVAYRTYEQYLAHPKFKRVRAMAFERACGLCEICGKHAAIDIHHVKYPPWGTFETNADNLLALCRRCHCQVHGKEI